LGHVDATVPVMPPDRLRVKPAAPPPPPVGHAGNRKTERLERRELLYSVVRDSMTRAGVLAASYKFKVLSLDVSGRQYLIMMELANQSAGDTGRLAEIEALMAKSAKMAHDILVTAVYWRVNEHVTAGLSPSQAAPPSQALKKAPEPPVTRPNVVPISSRKQVPQFEPLHQDEVAAFKRALASAAPAEPLAASGQIVTSGRRNPAPSVDFEDTQRVPSDERASPLSTTQYGDLN
jgi:hypothetical protein